MTSLSEVLGAELNFGNMLLPIQVSANFHDGIKIMSLAVDFNCLLVLTGLDVQIRSLFPVVGITFELSLLDQYLGVKEWSFTISVLSMLSDQLIGFRELLKLSVQVDGLIQHLVLDVVLSGLLELSLQSEHL